jgi:hypothetical protein
MSNIFLNTKPTPGGISVEWEVKGVLPADMLRRLPVAASLGLNATALESVDRVRTETAKNFTSRGPQSAEYFRQSFQVTKFSRRNDLEITFGSSRGLLQGRGASLLDHEDGTDRVAKGRNDFPYVPTYGLNGLRPGVSDLLPRWAYPKALGLVDSRGISGETVAGADRTGKRRGGTRGKRASENRKGFILRDKDGDAIGIFRRVPMAGIRVSAVREGGKKLSVAKRRRRGSGQSTLELLFITPKVVRIAPRLGFRRISDQVMVERINANFSNILDYLMDDNRSVAYSSLSDIGRGQIDRYLRGGRR